jgi:hypothetical protein
MSDVKRDVISINQNSNKNIQLNGVVIGFPSGNPMSRNYGCNRHRVFSSPNCLWPNWNFASCRCAMMHCMTERWQKKGTQIELRTNCNCSGLFRLSNMDTDLKDLLTNIKGLTLILMLYMNMFNLGVTITNHSKASAHSPSHTFNLMEEGNGLDDMVGQKSTHLPSLLQHHLLLVMFSPQHRLHTISLKHINPNSLHLHTGHHHHHKLLLQPIPLQPTSLSLLRELVTESLLISRHQLNLTPTCNFCCAITFLMYYTHLLFGLSLSLLIRSHSLLSLSPLSFSQLLTFLTFLSYTSLYTSGLFTPLFTMTSFICSFHS